jgi:hypothetical protein
VNKHWIFLKLLWCSQWGLGYIFFGATAAYAVDLRDPTTPLNQAPRIESVIDLSLDAIASIGNKRFAIINDKHVYEGDSVGGAVIQKINTGYVVYSYGGKNYTLNMRLSLIE